MGKWVKKKLGEYVVLQGGFAFQSKDFVEDGVPLIRIGDITKEGLCDENAVKLPVYFLDECKEFVLNEYDTIIAMSGATTGKCTIVSKKNLPALLNQRVGRFKIKNSSIDKLYLYYIVSSYYYQQKLLLDAIGGAQPNVSPRQIEKVICAFPILPDGSPDFSEQRRIASILSSADKVIDSTQKLIAKYKQIKQGMMEDLLKPKEGWKLVKLGECCEINPKTDTSKVLDDDIIVFVKMEDVSNDGFITSFNEKTYQSLQKKGFTVFQNDDVIFAKITPCMENGKGALVRGFDTKICMGSTEFHVIRACENISIDFIYQMTISKQFRLKAEMQMTGSAGQQRVPISFLEDYLFYIPDFSEQRRIASILSGIDAKIEAEEKVLEKYKKIKKGLMEKLLNCE